MKIMIATVSHVHEESSGPYMPKGQLQWSRFRLYSLSTTVPSVLRTRFQAGTLRHRVGKWLARVTQQVNGNSRVDPTAD